MLPPARLDQVDILLINGDSAYSDGYRFDLRPRQAVSLGGGGHRDLSGFGDLKVWAVAGIGNPQRFCLMLESLAIYPVMVDIPDHGIASLSALKRQQSWPILMTEKDAVKYTDAPIDDAWYVPVDVQMSERTEAMIMKQIHVAISND